MSPELEEKGKKRHRRTAQEIERKYRCEAPSCGKAYGSEGALKMHIRLKHAEEAPVPSLTQEDHQENEVSSPATLTPSSHASSTPNSPFVPEKVETTPEAACLPAAFSSDPQSLPQEPAEIDYNDFKEFRKRYCHIPLLRLNIGLWQAESQCCGDLVAKFSYKERTILWEIFDVGSLLRAVVPFDDLNGVGLELHHDDTATMVIELRCAPTFYKGVLQPHESTIWTQIGDFTEGMASTFRRHILHFSRRALNEPIEDIFRRDPRLQGLLLQGLPALKSPYFVPETVIPVRSPDWNDAQHQEHLIRQQQQQQQQQQPLSHSHGCHPLRQFTPPVSCHEGEGSEASEGDYLSKCAKQNSKNHPSFLGKHTAERVLLPCNHGVIATRDLLRECPCIICGTSYFFSFCAQRVVSNDEMWHCDACNSCKTKKEWHCSRCNKCTRVPPVPGTNRRGAQTCQVCAKQMQSSSSYNVGQNPPVSTGRGRKRKAPSSTPPSLYLY